jgi:glycosyltransferase involved in cell wall biosynthesis
VTTCLTIVRPGLPLPPPQAGDTVVAFDDFAQWIKSGKVALMPGRYSTSRILVHRLESSGRPLPLGLALRWMTRGAVRIEDVRGRARPIGVGTLARWVTQVAVELFGIDALLRRVEGMVTALEQESPRPGTAVDLSRPPLYLRSDLSFGVRAGGSVGHIAGVVNELEHFAAPPVFVTTDDIAIVHPHIQQHLVAPLEAFWNFKELPTFVLNDALEAGSLRALAGRTPAFVYQRYSLNNYTGIRIARTMNVPLVVEYNGSEIWMSRHWGRPIVHEALSSRIEQLNLRAADLVVVVSRAMKDEVVARGVDAARVLVNPNGVDPDRYSPDVDGSPVRAQYGLKDAFVIGFIGTFGPWHGAETLARAFVALRASNPALASTSRLLMIGEGATMAEVRRILSDGGALDSSVFTGLVPQEDGARYLAACDVLVSPHVPNSDGTPFFGSPTKLFEYMGMGKAIVASKLDQIGEVLEDMRTALLVPPGDVDALAIAIARLAGDRALRERLGADARRAVLERYTWREHTRRTIDQLVGRVRR